MLKMRKRQNLLRLTAAALAALLPHCSQGAEARPTWSVKIDEAHACERRSDYQQAVVLYRQVLDSLPASEENVRAQTDSSLAIDLIKLRRYDKSLEFGYKHLEMVKLLKLKHRMEPDVLLSATNLIEACVFIPDLNLSYTALHKVVQQFCRLSISLKEIINPADPTLTEARINYARSFVSLFDDVGAEKELTKLLSTLKPGSAKHLEVSLDLAALQAKDRRSEMSEKLFKELLKTRTETAVLQLFARGQFFAADYSGEEITLNRALAKLGKTTAATRVEEAQIYMMLGASKIDHGDPKGAEPCFRRALELREKAPVEPEALSEAKGALAACLRMQNRSKDADAILPLVKPRNSAEYSFLLTDEEKAELQKSKNFGQTNGSRPNASSSR